LLTDLIVFLDKSRQKIIKEVNGRGLSPNKLKSLYQAGIQSDFESEYVCPNCNSGRYFTETEYEMRQSRFGDNIEVAIDTKWCRICGFNPAKSKQKGLINKIKQALGFYQTVRQKRPELDGKIFF
jgi:hypothetical protein